MLELFGHNLGTPFQGGTLLTLIIILAGLVTQWMKGAPARQIADTADRKAVADDHAMIRREYLSQIESLRDELRGNRKEWAAEDDARKAEIVALSARLAVTESESRRRGDRISQLTFLVQLAMGELERTAPGSQVLKQAQMLLIQIAQPLDANPAETLNDLRRIDDAVRGTVSRLRPKDPRDTAEQAAGA